MGGIPVVKYDLENGVLKFEGTDPNVEVVLTRDSKNKTSNGFINVKYYQTFF